MQQPGAKQWTQGDLARDIPCPSCWQSFEDRLGKSFNSPLKGPAAIAALAEIADARARFFSSVREGKEPGVQRLS